MKTSSAYETTFHSSGTSTAVILTALVLWSGSIRIQAQVAAPPPPPVRTAVSPNVTPGPAAAAARDDDLVRFDLDFPGGTPADLLKAIEASSGVHVNAVIPEETADTPIPPLKMKQVTVPRLFEAIQMASMKTIPYVSGRRDGNFSYQQYQYSHGFQSRIFSGDNTVWYFRVDKPNLPPPEDAVTEDRFCRFYHLEQYLVRYQVEDITTALKTAWDMLHDNRSNPDITYHKDTQLLIAVGTPEKLRLIDDVLKQLKPEPNPQRIDGWNGVAVPDEKPSKSTNKPVKF
jgi:hypothetical protein